MKKLACFIMASLLFTGVCFSQENKSGTEKKELDKYSEENKFDIGIKDCENVPIRADYGQHIYMNYKETENMVYALSFVVDENMFATTVNDIQKSDNNKYVVTFSSQNENTSDNMYRVKIGKGDNVYFCCFLLVVSSNKVSPNRVPDLRLLAKKETIRIVKATITDIDETGFTFTYVIFQGK